MVTKNLGNPRVGAGQGKAPWWALPDRWNPRVWVRDWLTKPTLAELETRQRNREHSRAVHEALLAFAHESHELAIASLGTAQLPFDTPRGASPSEGSSQDRPGASGEVQ